MNMENRMKSFLMRLVACAAVGFAAFAAEAAVSVRLLFVYDAGAQDYLSQNSLDAYSVASSCVTQMNNVLANSRLTGTDNLTQQSNDYFSYTLAGVTTVQARNSKTATAWSQAYNVVLGNTAESDVSMDGLLEERARYAADIIVMLIYRSGDADGNSTPYQGTDAEYAVNFAGKAVSVVDVAMAVAEGSGAFGAFQICSHEVAHTLGCGHADTQDNQSGQQSSSYSFGYQFKYPGDQNYTLYQGAGLKAWWGCTVMAYKEHFFKNADGTFMSAEDVLALTGWTDADDREHLWNNFDGSYGTKYAKGIWNYCNMLPYFSSPDLCFVNISGETATVVPTSWATAHYDAGTYVPMGDTTHNNRQVLIDNCGYASRWHLGVKFTKAGDASVVNGKADKLTLSSLSDNCSVYYTTDGTEPTKATGTLYSAPISLTQTTTIKARSYDANNNAGDVFTREYTVLPLAAALGNTELAWTTSSPAWYVDSGVARSAQLSTIGTSSSLTTTIKGPASLTFNYSKYMWSGDVFTVSVGGVEKLRIAPSGYDTSSGSSGEIEIPEGDQLVEFNFVLGASMYGINKINVSNVSVVYAYDPSEEPDDPTPAEPTYDGPTPTAVWVSGEFEDEATFHGGYAIALNDNTVNDSGNIVIGSATTLGAVIDTAAGDFTNATVLVKYTIPSGGAPADYAVPAGFFNTKDFGALASNGSSDLRGYWLDGSTLRPDGFAFSSPAPSMPESGYLLISTWAIKPNPGDHGTAVYTGATIASLSGGEKTGLRFTDTNNRVTKIAIGGPTTAKAVPWSGMVIEAVAVFGNCWLAPSDVALYEFPEAKAVVPSWAVASITPESGETTYYRSVVDALFAIVHGDVDADTVKVLDGSSVDYSSAGFAYDSETQTYTKIKIAIAKIDNGIILLEYTTLAAACEEADLQNIGVVELLAARDSISEAIPSGWSYVSPEDSGTEYGTILKTISEIPGTVSNIAITQENVSASADGEWAEVSTKPIYLTLPNSVNDFTISFDADIPENTYGTLASWDSGTHDIRIVVTNDVEKMALWRDGSSGVLTAVKDDSAILIPPGEHYIEVIYYRGSGTTVNVDGAQYYTSGSLRFGSNTTTKLALGGSAKGNPDDVLKGLKVKNFRWGKSPTEPGEASENFPVLDYVTRLDGTVYNGNDENRAVITNWQTQITGVAKRPVPEGKEDEDFKTIDLLFVYDTPGKAYVESNEIPWNGASALEVYSAKATAKMNQILCTTDMDTNFWFRMVGVHTVDGTGGTLKEILGKCEGLTGEYTHMLELRDRYGADVIVCPSPYGGGFGGLARLNTLDEIKSRGQNAAYHFATVLLNYSQTHAWVHEIGHNMSLNHYPPANFDPANTWRGLGFQHKIAVDGTSMSSVMAELGYADFCGGFSSINHIYHGSRLSISNHLDSTGVLLEAAPYVSQWRSTRVPETQEIKCSVTYGSSLPGDTEFELSFPDPEAEIWYQVYGLNNNDFVKYTEPFTVPESAGYAYINAYVVKDGVSSATNLVNYSMFDSTWDTLLGSPRLPWAIYKSIDGGWAAASGEEYLEVADSFTGSRTSESTLSTTVVGPDTLSFEHSELLKDNPYRGSWPHTFADSSFTVWVDNEPVYMLRGATNTIGSWVSTDIAIPEGTHKVDFTYSHRSGYVSGETVRIKNVALASAQEPEDPPVDPDSYAIEPLAVWYKDFKTAEKGGYTLSTSGTTAIADDTYGSTLTIGDAAAVIDTSAANTNELTVLVKYSSAPSTVNAPVVTFGEALSNGVKLDVGAYMQSALTPAVNRSWNGGNNKWVALNTPVTLDASGGYLLCARKSGDMMVYTGASLDNMTGGATASPADITFTADLSAIGIGGPSGMPNADATWSPFTGFVVEKIAVFKGYHTPRDLIPLENPEDAATLSIADNATWNFAAGATRTYESIGALSASGTIAVTNDTIGVGVYKLAKWTMPQTMSAGYGRVGTLSVPNLPSNLTAELVYGANAIYLRVYDETVQFLKPALKVWPYGDSITEGFNAGNSKANYRVLIGQKLKLLGYNVAMVGCYDKIQAASGTDNFMDAIDPSGAVIPDEWKWHSAKHGGTLGVTSVTSYQRSAMVENVDTLCAQAGNPDVVLLHGGINDLSVVGDASTVFANWTNVVWRILEDLPQTKIVVSTTLYATYDNKATLNARSDSFNELVKAQVAKAEGEDGAFPAGRVYLADLNTYVKSTETGVLSSDGLHPDWWGHDQMAEGFLSQVTNIFPSANGPFNSYLDYVDDSSLGAAAKTELDGYRNGFTLAQTITVASTNAPTVVNGEGVTENIGKVGYFVEYVRADNEAHKWVWVDMDAPATTLADLGLPTANHQQIVSSLHVMSNHNGIDNIATDDDTATGWIEFTPFDYTGAASGLDGAPVSHGGNDKSMFDWNDTLGESGTMGSMQVFRLAPPSGRPAQALFAYNNWQSDSTAAEFGIGNFAQHFWGGAQTLDYTYTKGLEKMNASAYRVKRIEIWTKEAPSNNGKATVVRVHPRLTRGLAREALLGIRFDNALGGNASAFDVHFRLVNCTKADITDIKYWRQPYTHNYGFYEAEATQGPAATVAAGDDATEFTASFPAGSVWFYPQVNGREDSDYLWVTATINPEISPDAQIWVSVPTEKIKLSNGGVFDVVNGAETAPHRVFPFVHQIGAYLRQDGTALTGTWAGKLEDSPANRVGNLTDIVVCNDFLVAYDSENDTFKTTWDARGRNNTAQVAHIKALRDQYNPKCMIRASLTKGSGTITVDGVTGRPIACAAASAARRQQLIDAILAVMESAGLDGLDIDWEYPGDHDVTTANTQRDWHSYGLLMRDLAAAFFDKGYVLSFCSNLGYQMAPSGYHAAFHAADFVNAMAYGNTTLNASPKVMMTGIQVCTSRGVPSRRIVVGQAMYAYEVQNPGWGSVVQWLKDEWPDDKTRWWDADLVWKSRSVTKSDSTVISTEKETFEGPASYHAKCNWCRANGYGGVMSWGYYTDVSWDDADLMSLSRHQAKSCWPRENWSWPTPPQDSDGAYLLDSEEDWFWLRDNPGVNARFAADIALVHDPLPIETFSGTLDGAGHTLTISNDVWLAYDTNPALIRTLTGTVKNLKIDLYGRVVSRASRWNDTTVNTTANTLASGTHNAAVLAASLGASGVIDGVELFIRPGAEVQGPQRVAGLAASVWVANGSHAEICNSSVHVDGAVRSLARNTAEGDITVQNQVAGGLAGWVACPGARNIVVTNNIVSIASTGRVAVETGSSSSAGGVIGDLNNVNPLVQGNAVYVASGAAVAANEGAGNVRTSYANASYSISSSANAGQTTFFIEDGAAALADSIGGKSDATVEVSSYGEATDGISVDAVAGFWYSVIYGDELVSGGIGGEKSETAPVKATASGPLTLDAPKDGEKRFYRVKVAPVAE